MAGLTLNADWSVNSWVIFSGLILITLAEVFRLGADMKGDLETARKIQFDLVPGEIFRKNDVVVQARMRPAKIVGGDLLRRSLELDERRLAVIVGDVTGKGLPAAMLMASVLGSVRALCSAGLRGGELIAALNRHVGITNASGDRLVTLFYGELDTTTGEMTCVNAGHNPPILLRSDGRVDRLQPTAMVLGVMADTVVESRQVEIKTADRLLLFTDGFSQASFAILFLAFNWAYPAKKSCRVIGLGSRQMVLEVLFGIDIEKFSSHHSPPTQSLPFGSISS